MVPPISILSVPHNLFLCSWTTYQDRQTSQVDQLLFPNHSWESCSDFQTVQPNPINWEHQSKRTGNQTVLNSETQQKKDKPFLQRLPAVQSGDLSSILSCVFPVQATSSHTTVQESLGDPHQSAFFHGTTTHSQHIHNTFTT